MKFSGSVADIFIIAHAIWFDISILHCSGLCFFRGHSVEAAHHKFQKSLLGITWRDKVRNEDIGKEKWFMETGRYN